jgi:hypothetical protein
MFRFLSCFYPNLEVKGMWRNKLRTHSNSASNNKIGCTQLADPSGITFGPTGVRKSSSDKQWCTLYVQHSPLLRSLCQGKRRRDYAYTVTGITREHMESYWTWNTGIMFQNSDTVYFHNSSAALCKFHSTYTVLFSNHWLTQRKFFFLKKQQLKPFQVMYSRCPCYTTSMITRPRDEVGPPWHK